MRAAVTMGLAGSVMNQIRRRRRGHHRQGHRMGLGVWRWSGGK